MLLRSRLVWSTCLLRRLTRTLCTPSLRHENAVYFIAFLRSPSPGLHQPVEQLLLSKLSRRSLWLITMHRFRTYVLYANPRAPAVPTSIAPALNIKPRAQILAQAPLIQCTCDAPKHFLIFSRERRFLLSHLHGAPPSRRSRT